MKCLGFGRGRRKSRIENVVVFNMETLRYVGSLNGIPTLRFLLTGCSLTLQLGILNFLSNRRKIVS